MSELRVLLSSTGLAELSLRSADRGTVARLTAHRGPHLPDMNLEISTVISDPIEQLCQKLVAFADSVEAVLDNEAVNPSLRLGSKVYLELVPAKAANLVKEFHKRWLKVTVSNGSEKDFGTISASAFFLVEETVLDLLRDVVPKVETVG